MSLNKIKVASEGLFYIAIFGILCWITAVFGFVIISVILFIITALIAYFFRDPDRLTPQDPHAIVAPADGRIVDVSPAIEETFLGNDMKRIGIFLSLTDCHINRSPLNGVVVATKYIKGKFSLAHSKSASSQNERLSTLIESDEKENIVLVQIAGFLARRIVSYLAIGSQIRRGERFGMIKFGSRVDIYLPLNCEVVIDIGDFVRGGETIIGWLKEGEE
ncbi:MAG: phosphatidylserine decarboxylase family protein [Deltaproteobacteria bacterium]|nr:phosphatidylserine decarboxylase family protein [Deltaproteobacteria bacterium]